MKSIERKLTEFDKHYDEGEVRKTKEQIERFNKIFPREKIKKLTMQEYILGSDSENEENFCWWVEYGTEKVAAIGGYASKHRLYLSSKDKSYRYPDRYSDEKECFEDIKSNLLKLYDMCAEDEISEFDTVDLPHNQAVKIAYLIKPDQFIPVLNPDHLSKICTFLKLDQNDLNSLEKNRKILGYCRNNDISRKWHTSKIGNFFYSRYGISLKKAEAGQPSMVNQEPNLPLLNKKKQVIFYGPPGTGKTFMTYKYATALIRGRTNTEGKRRSKPLPELAEKGKTYSGDKLTDIIAKNDRTVKGYDELSGKAKKLLDMLHSRIMSLGDDIQPRLGQARKGDLINKIDYYCLSPKKRLLYLRCGQVRKNDPERRDSSKTIAINLMTFGKGKYTPKGTLCIYEKPTRKDAKFSIDKEEDLKEAMELIEEAYERYKKL